MTASNGDKAGVEQLDLDMAQAVMVRSAYPVWPADAQQYMAEAFARHAQAAKLEGIRIGLEAGAKCADAHGRGRREAAKDRSEARDHESMAIEAMHITIAIRAIDPASLLV